MAGLLNVLPAQSMNRFGNRKNRNTISLGQFSLSNSIFVQLANLANVIFSQLRLTVRRSNMILTATFFNTVALIIESRTKKQMGRINTSAIIARMAHVQSRIKSAVSHFVRKPMGGHRATRSNAKSSVSVNANATRPMPTRVSFVYVFYKPYFGRNSRFSSFSLFGAAISPHSLVMG